MNNHPFPSLIVVIHTYRKEFIVDKICCTLQTLKIIINNVTLPSDIKSLDSIYTVLSVSATVFRLSVSEIAKPQALLASCTVKNFPEYYDTIFDPPYNISLE